MKSGKTISFVVFANVLWITTIIPVRIDAQQNQVKQVHYSLRILGTLWSADQSP